MKEQKDYSKDIAEIRSMMERSSKFLSLAGWAGIMAGIYALLGAYIAKYVFNFNSDEKDFGGMQSGTLSSGFSQVIFLAIVILILAIGTAVFLSYRKSNRRQEQLWNPTAKRMLFNMAIPLVAGGLLIIILISKGLISLVAPLTLLFYGLALYSASKFTYEEVRSLGLIQIGLGLIGACFVEYGLLLWALGFGVFHIIYGIYMHYKYEK